MYENLTGTEFVPTAAAAGRPVLLVHDFTRAADDAFGSPVPLSHCVAASATGRRTAVA